MLHVPRYACCCIALAVLLAACSSLSGTRQLSPDYEPAAPHRHLDLDTAALPPVDSLGGPRK